VRAPVRVAQGPARAAELPGWADLPGCPRLAPGHPATVFDAAGRTIEAFLAAAC
jgi:hypothetical protein